MAGKGLLEMLGAGDDQQSKPDMYGKGAPPPPGMGEEVGGSVACPACGAKLKLEAEKPAAPMGGAGGLMAGGQQPPMPR